VFGAQKNTLQVDRHDPSPVFEACFCHWRAKRNAGAVHQDIEPRVSLQDFSQRFFPVCFGGDIQLRSRGNAARLRSVRGRRGSSGKINVAACHRGAVAGQQEGRCATYA
jgi:hypothetical protein